MTNPEANQSRERWSRPPIERDGPVRTTGTLFRSVDPSQGGASTTEDAVVAAVRMAYKIAQANVARSTRISQRLRRAGDRAVGGQSPRNAVDATQDLVTDTMMSALGWVEAFLADDSRLRRVSTAQFRLIGSLLGLVPDRDPSPDSAVQAGPAPTKPVQSSDALKAKIVLKEKGRPVRVQKLEFATREPIEQTSIYFYSISHIDSDPLEASLVRNASGEVLLTLSTASVDTLGCWRAAVCSETGEQLGVVEIEL
jgi:hypothetical protein